MSSKRGGLNTKLSRSYGTKQSQTLDTTLCPLVKSVSSEQEELYQNQEALGMSNNTTANNGPDTPANQKNSSNESQECTHLKIVSNSSPEEHTPNGTAGDTTQQETVLWSYPDSKTKIYLITLPK